MKRHRRCLIASSILFGLGLGAAGAIVPMTRNADCGEDDPGTLDICIPAGPFLLSAFAGMMSVGGLVGMPVKAGKLSKRKREYARSRKRTRANCPPGSSRMPPRRRRGRGPILSQRLRMAAKPD